MKAFFILLLLLAFAPTSLAQTAEALHASVRSAVDGRRYSDALGALREFEEKYPEIFGANNFDYLAGRLHERVGNSSAAAAAYLGVVKRASILKPYALFHLAGLARGSGNLFLERTYLDEIAALYPDSLIVDAARIRWARSWFDSRNYEQAAKAFEHLSLGAAKPTGRKKEDPVARENRLLLARSLLLSGNPAAAREIFTSLIGTVSNPAQPDDIVLAAVRALDKLELDPAVNDRKVPKLGDYEHLRRASVYQFNRDFAGARLHYAAVIADHPTSGIAPDAIFQTGRGYVQEGNLSEGINWFERVIEQYPEHPVSRDALLQAGSAYGRVSKYRESVRRYQEFIAKYPDEERLDRAYLNIVDVLRDEGEETEALKWAVRTQEAFRGKLAETQAVFSEVRIHLARSNWDAALAGIEKLLTAPDLGGVSIPGGTTKEEIAFVRAYALEQKRSYPEAIEAFLTIPDGRAAYYGGLATERLRSLAVSEAAKAAVEAKLGSLNVHAETKDAELSRRNIQAAIRLTADSGAREKLLDSLRRVYSVLPGYRDLPTNRLLSIGPTELRKAPLQRKADDAHRELAEELAFLDLFDEAALELEAARKQPGTNEADLAYTAAVMHNRGDRAHRSVAFAEPRWRGVPADFQVELMPREAVEMLYPAPYADALRRHADPRNVDPRFLLSIVRQESRYRPDVKSYAAARGMMQFISTTSEKIAAELDRTNFDQDELYHPATAILFGSQYVQNLFKLFPSQPEAVAASYNAGEDNMRRWMKRSKSGYPGVYVPEIAFSQTKDYVYKVMANYRVYRQFYDQNLVLRTGS